MNLNVEKLIYLSKIKYKNEWYQIFVDETGKRYFLKINGKRYEYVSLKELTQLKRIYESKFKGICYDKKNTKYVVLLGTEILFVSLFALKLHDISLTRDGYNNIIIETNENLCYEQVKKEDFINYINVNYDINYIYEINPNISDKYKPFIEEYIEKHNGEDLTLFYYNMSNIKIEELDSEDIKNNSDNPSAIAYFDYINHKMVFNKNIVLEENKDTIFHEFRHASKCASISLDEKIIYVSFTMKNENDIEIGSSVLEGINAKYTSPSYATQKNYVEMLMMILGEEKIKEYEDNGDLNSLLNALEEISGTKEDAIRLIMLMDDELKSENNNITYSKESKKEIRLILMNYFLQNEKNKLNTSTEFDYIVKYSNYIENCDQFEILLKKQNIYLKKDDMEESYSRIDMEKEVISELEEIFEKRKIDNLEEYLNKYNLTIDEANDFNSWILVKTEACSEKIDIPNENIKIEYQEPITYNDNGKVKVLYMYQLYIKKNYIIDNKEEVLNYISLEEYINVLNNLNGKVK